MSTENLKTVLKGNWQTLEGTIKTQFGKLTNNDLKVIDGSLDKLSGLLLEKYGLEKEEVEAQLCKIADEAGFKINGKLNEIWNQTTDAANRVKDSLQESAHRVKDSLQDSAETIKQKTADYQENVTEYVKANPMKAVGIAALVGVVLGKIFKIRK